MRTKEGRNHSQTWGLIDSQSVEGHQKADATPARFPRLGNAHQAEVLNEVWMA
ncbi:MAG: hypothetical protein F6K35_00880 [Okeania sp. SIO2H7]|nr:hypothetical protein [Okeania sp. SIO2H7]